MTLKVFAVRDRAIDAYGQPFFVPAVGLALRSFSDEVNRSGSPMNSHPDDYDLYEVGEWDDSTGTLFPITPRMVSIGKDVVRPPS